MTIEEQISEVEQMNKQEFQDFFFHILKIANTKYDMSFVVTKDTQEISLNENKKEKRKRIFKSKGIIKLENELDNINIRDYIYDEPFYNKTNK